jgi:hypothetical protein
MTKEEFVEFFWLLVETLEPNVVLVLKNYLEKRHGPNFLTTDEEIAESEKLFGPLLKPRALANTDGTTFVFGLSKIAAFKNPGPFQESLIAVAYHEIAHAYLFATGEFDMGKIRQSRRTPYLSALIGPGDQDYERQCEKRTMELEQLWVHRLRNDRPHFEALREHRLIKKISDQFFLDPL